MACVTHCEAFCYSDECTAFEGPLLAWDYSPVKPFPTSSGDTIHNENLEQVALSITEELERRSLSAFSFDSILGSEENTPDGGTIIYGENPSQESMKELRDAINTISSGYVTYSTDEGTLLTYDQIDEARTNIDILRSTCVCNSDCGGHLVCPCYGDCGCAYDGEEPVWT